MTKTFQLQRKINAPIVSYTLLLLGWTPFSFRIASILRGIDSTRPFLRDFGPYEQILSLNVEAKIKKSQNRQCSMSFCQVLVENV